MPDTGAPWNLRYPDPTDLVVDGPEQFQDLAEDVAAGLTLAGGLVEVKTVNKTDTQVSSVAGGASVAITGLTIAHTVADVANRVILIAQISGAHANADRTLGGAITAGGTQLNIGDASSSRTRVSGGAVSGTANDRGMQTMVLSFVYTPGVLTSVTYGVDAINVGAADSVYINRNRSNDTDSRNPVGASTLTLLEVKV